MAETCRAADHQTYGRFVVQQTNDDSTIRVHRLEPHQPSYVFSL